MMHEPASFAGFPGDGFDRKLLVMYTVLADHLK